MKKLKYKINYDIIKKNIFLHKYTKCNNLKYKYQQYYINKNNITLIIDYNYNTQIKNSCLLDGTNKRSLKILSYNP